jgi:diguanylate cyclase (GGDEF)-like protein
MRRHRAAKLASASTASRRERLAEEVERGRRTFSPFAVALADVDGFKAVNDARGHHAGDAVLAGVAAILARESRRVDVVARWGGEEFLLLMPDTPPEGAHAHAEALRRRVAETPVRHGDAPDETVRVTLTIGLCAVASPADLADAEELVRRADAALYHGKRAGKDRVETALSAIAP